MNLKQQRSNQLTAKPPKAIRFRGRVYSLSEASELAARAHNQGNFQTAADLYNLLSAQVPKSVEFHINRGVTLQALKRYADALASFDQAIALKPDHAEAHNNRGAVLQMMQRYAEAIASYDQAIALKPDYANAHYNRGSALKKLRRYDEALASFDQAIFFKPDHAEAHNNRGVVLQEMKRYDEAIASFDRAITLNPDHVVASNNRGVISLIKGDLPAAEKMFLNVVALKPDFPDAWFNLVNVRKYQTADNPDVKNLLRLLNRPGIVPENQEHLYFSLGKIYDDCGSYDEAFECYRRANHIRNAAAAYSAAATTEMNDGIIEVFNRDFLGRPFAFASDSRLPLFIVGMPRSGTTLLANILSNHPAIATAGELPELTDLASSLPELTAKGIPYLQAAKQVNAAVATLVITAYERRLRRDVAAGIPFVIDKNPLNFRNLGFIAMLFPKARIIHCTRHPWDTGFSSYFQRFPLHLNYSFDLRNIGHFYGEYSRLMEHWRTLPLNLMEIRYEEMILNTEPVTRRLLDFLGLDWDERCLSPHTNPCPVETASQWQVRQPIYRQSIARWQHYEKHLGPLKEMLLLAGQTRLTETILS